MTYLMQVFTWLGEQFRIIDIFVITASEIQQRLRAKIRKDEIAAVGFCVLILIWFVLQSNKFRTYYDLQNFLFAGAGDFSHYYYAYWAVPFFALLAKLPHPYPFTIVGVLNIIGTVFAVRVFGGKIAPLLVSVHMIYILSQGQIAGILLGGFALFFVGLAYRKWHAAGFGMLIVMTKFQLGVLPVLSLLILWDDTLRNKIKTFIVPFIMIGASFVLYPGWIFDLIQNIQDAPPYADGSISLWQWIGPFALTLWVVPLAFKLPKSDRFTLLLTANALALPYFQQTDLLILFSLFSGIGAAAANIPFLIPSSAPWMAIRFLCLIPLGVYLKQIFVSLRSKSKPFSILSL